MLADVRGQRMHLEREIAAADGVEEIEAYGKLRAEGAFDEVAEESAGLHEDQVEGRDFHLTRPKAEKKAIFFRHAIETPGVVGLVARQIADGFHPVAPPGSWIEKRNDSKRSM